VEAELAHFCREHDLAPDHIPTDMQVWWLYPVLLASSYLSQILFASWGRPDIGATSRSCETTEGCTSSMLFGSTVESQMSAKFSVSAHGTILSNASVEARCV